MLTQLFYCRLMSTTSVTQEIVGAVLTK